MHGIYDFTKERFERVMPGLTYEEDRDNWDYVYLQEKLATLSGRKLHGQKNHYNAFVKAHPDFVYEPITMDNMMECELRRALVRRAYGRGPFAAVRKICYPGGLSELRAAGAARRCNPFRR